ncbi:ABC transporter substrate-binding protein [Salana multivorans]
MVQSTTARKRMIRGVAAVGAAGLMLGLAACGGGSGGGGGGGSEGGGDGEITGSITFQTWSLTPTFQDYLDGVIAAFEEAHPGAKVTLQDQPGDGYDQKVLTQAASNTLPDVINLPPDFALPLAKVELLDNLAESDPDLESTYVAGGLEAYQFPGLEGTWAYPWYLNTDINYWNTELMTACGLDPAALPTTDAELFEQAKTYNETCKDSYLMSRAPGVEDFARAGIEVINAEGTEFTFATPEAAEIVERYVTAFQDGLLPNSVLNDDYLGNSTMFTQGEVAWSTGGAPAYANFVKDNPSLEGKIAINEALDVPSLYVQGIGVAATSKNIATARAFAAFITNAENQNAFGEIVAVFPSTIASAEDPYFSESDGTVNGDAKVLAFESLTNAKSLIPVQFNAAMGTLLRQQISLAMRGDIPAADALEAAQTQINQMLADAA